MRARSRSGEGRGLAAKLGVARRGGMRFLLRATGVRGVVSAGSHRRGHACSTMPRPAGCRDGSVRLDQRLRACSDIGPGPGPKARGRRRWGCGWRTGSCGDERHRLPERCLLRISKLVVEVIRRTAGRGQSVEVVTLVVCVADRECHGREHLVAEGNGVLPDWLALGPVSNDGDRNEWAEAVDDQLAGRRRRAGGDDN